MKIDRQVDKYMVDPKREIRIDKVDRQIKTDRSMYCINKSRR